MKCRSLEKVITWHEVEFLARKCCKLPSDEEQSRVAAVVAEADAPDYWIRASKDGNREQHYRGVLKTQDCLLIFIYVLSDSQCMPYIKQALSAGFASCSCILAAS